MSTLPKKENSNSNKILIAFSRFRAFLGKHTFLALVVFPFVMYSFYQIAISSDRYESIALVFVKEPDSSSTLDPAMAVLTGFGGSAPSLDTELIAKFIHSNDMLTYLESETKLSEHYSNSEYDFFSRLENNSTVETLLDYYRNHVSVEIDEKSQVITLSVQAFTAEFARLLAAKIVERSEWYINEISHRLAENQLKFIREENEKIDKRLKLAKANLLNFQQQYGLLDPEAEGMAIQQIAYGIESQIAEKRTQLRLLKTSMSENAPSVIQAQSELDSLLEQLETERSRLSEYESNNDVSIYQKNGSSVSEVMAKFTDFKIDLELALAAYTSSQVSLEKARIEAYRQIKFLMTVQQATYPEKSSYPKVFYNVSLFLLLNIMFYFLGKIVIATIKELHQ
ncbi:lipopolysaccharide biosynthesis protein [Glaciecola sp. 1036]|uniref:lipopolysaccharide biosynthesis protein n=1 Tax=Alteromonadaceae TaxID=72275 RepID=UPI003D03DBA5